MPAGKQKLRIQPEASVLLPLSARMLVPQISPRLWRFLPCLLPLLAWELLTELRPDLLFLFSSPSRIAQALLGSLRTEEFREDCLYTASSAVLGLLCGSLCGTFLAGVLVLFRRSLIVVRQYLSIISSVPLLAFAPLLIFIFGVSWWAKVAIASVMTGLSAFQMAAKGAEQARSDYAQYLSFVDSTPLNLARHVLLPAARAWVVEGFRANINLSLMAVFTAEFITANRGLGQMILREASLFRVELVWVGVLGLIGISLSVGALLNALCHFDK